MRKIWYYSLRKFVRIALSFYFREVKIVGEKNIPARKPVIFLPNHQNTFLDALLVATSNARICHFLARADVFEKPVLKWFMSTFNLHPIYRLRDGVGQLGRNEKIFSICKEALRQGECVMLHPEGSHHLKKRLKTLSKGFSRIAFGAKEKYPDIEIDLIAVGLNYEAPTKMGSRLSIYYSKPISLNTYQNSEQNALQMRDEVSRQLKEITVHISHSKDHDEEYKKLKYEKIDLTDPRAANQFLRYGKISKVRGSVKNPTWYYLLLPLALINCWPIILLWKQLKKKIKDPAFYGAIKFSLGLILFPPLLILYSFVIFWNIGIVLALFYFLLSLISVKSLALLEKQEDYVLSS